MRNWLSHTLWPGFARGLLLGLTGGVIAGCIEALALMRETSTGRAALLEAALYALVVNGLASAGICALLGLALAMVLRLVPNTLEPRTILALYVSVTAAVVTTMIGWFWAFRANGASMDDGIPSQTVLAILFISVLVATSLFPLARQFGYSLLRSTRRVAFAALPPAIVLALVFPVQVGLEAASGHRSEHTTMERAVDPSVLEASLQPELQAALQSAFARTAGSGSSSPNVLLITVDALRADHLGVCGSEWMQTPAIDLLGRYSVVACNAYTHQPQTNPALASLFTGTYPATHGVRLHMVDRLSDTLETMATVLQRSGFNTGAIIPWTSLEPAFSGFHRGFQTYEAFVQNEPEVLKNPATAALAGLYRRVTQQVAVGTAVDSMLNLRKNTEAEIDGRADITAHAAVSWLANHGQSRFFLWVHYFDPHYPWTPPDPWAQLYDQGYEGKYDGSMQFIWEMRAGVFDPTPRDAQYLRALYASEVSYADHYIGQLLGYMAKQGLLENTIVILTADHGESLGERGERMPDGTNWLHGDDLYDTGIQVPVIIYDPRVRRTHQQLTVPVQHVDIMPTMLELVGAPIPRQVQGRSLIPIMNGQDHGGDRFSVTSLGDDSLTSIVAADGWKLIVNRNTGARELYFRPDDPGETTNLAGANPEQVIALSRRLDAWAQANQQGGVAGAPATPGRGG